MADGRFEQDAAMIAIQLVDDQFSQLDLVPAIGRVICTWTSQCLEQDHSSRIRSNLIRFISLTVGSFHLKNIIWKCNFILLTLFILAHPILNKLINLWSGILAVITQVLQLALPIGL